MLRTRVLLKKFRSNFIIGDNTDGEPWSVYLYRFSWRISGSSTKLRPTYDGSMFEFSTEVKTEMIAIN